MRVFQGIGLVTVVLTLSTARADDLKSGPEEYVYSFKVKAVTGPGKGKSFCYV